MEKNTRGPTRKLLTLSTFKVVTNTEAEEGKAQLTFIHDRDNATQRVKQTACLLTTCLAYKYVLPTILLQLLSVRKKNQRKATNLESKHRNQAKRYLR